jgi:hypothetical protein
LSVTIASDALGALAGVEGNRTRRVTEQILEHAAAGPVVLQIAKRHTMRYRRVAVADAHGDERLGMLDRERPQQEPVDDREHGHRGTDADSKRQRGRAAEDGRTPQRT